MHWANKLHTNSPEPEGSAYAWGTHSRVPIETWWFAGGTDCHHDFSGNCIVPWLTSHFVQDTLSLLNLNIFEMLPVECTSAGLEVSILYEIHQDLKHFCVSH